MARLITKRQEYLLTLWMFKYYPVIGSFLIWLYVGLLIFDNRLIFKHNITSDSFISMACFLFLMINFVLIFVSDVLKLCRLPRAMFVYIGLVESCISYEYFIGFENLLLLSRVIVFLLEIILVLYMILYWKRFNKSYNIRSRCYDRFN